MSFAQNEKLKIYFDCEYCNSDYYKQELDYVEFVRDRNYADVHILVTKQQNASNGKHYVLEFIGNNKYADLKNKTEFDTTSETTTEAQRDLMLKNLKLGLIPFWIRNGIADKITVSLKKESKKDNNSETKDPWNKWTFKISLRGFFNGQESSSSRYINGNFRITKVTEENKFNLAVGLSNSKSKYIYGEDEIISEKKSTYAYGSDIISLNNHWSAGLFAQVGNSLFENKAFYYSVKPGIEYNFFDYKDSQKKSLYITYKIGSVFNRYYDLTVFDKTEEYLWQHNLELGGGLVTKWGNISSSISYRSYLHDANLNGFSADLNTNLRLFKGFSLNLWGSYGLSHDQINIAANGATLEELLLQQKQIKSGYDYYGSIGISYTFGSIYNTIVNPRFDL
jgi:hypothetical protein